MPDSPDKVAERWWARFLGGVRHPSQGISHADLSGFWFSCEHKYRKLEQYSAEFRKAIQQMDENKKRDQGKRALVAFTFHGTRGINARRFLMIEVYPKDIDARTLLLNIVSEIDKESL